MPKRLKLSLFFKIGFIVFMPVIAGFFAFGNFFDLSTQPKNSSGDIIKASDNKAFYDKPGQAILGFLTSVLGSSNPEVVPPEKPENNTSENSAIPFGSVLNSFDPLGNLGTFLKNDPVQNNIVSEIAGEAPAEEPAKSLYNYFVTSSGLGFEGGDIQLAIALAANGETDNLNKIIAGYEGSLDGFRHLEAPPLAIAIHEQSLALLERYIIFLKNVRRGQAGSVEKTWNSEERNEIITESQKIIVEIKKLETQYNFFLPEDVLPQ